jgi:hypothetical protein
MTGGKRLVILPRRENANVSRTNRCVGGLTQEELNNGLESDQTPDGMRRGAAFNCM